MARLLRARRVNTPPGLGDLQGVAVISRNDAWAVGQSETSPNDVTALTVHRNGKRCPAVAARR